METRPISVYVNIGAIVRYLINLREGWPASGSGHVVENVNRLLELCDECGLHVTRRVCEYTLHALVEKWEEDDRQNGEAPERRLTKDDVAEFLKGATAVESTLIAESNGTFAHVTRDKRYSTEKLLNDMAFLMAPGVFDFLPEVARYDFGEAGKCIAFERPTAAAFHLMRGTEDVLRWFYKTIVKRGRKQLMWGPMVTHLASRRDAPPAVLLSNLDNLRKNFRNPTQHPEKIYDIQEAQDLLALSLDVVNRMVRYLQPELVTSTGEEFRLKPGSLPNATPHPL
jgi:hypothetical protein